MKKIKQEKLEQIELKKKIKEDKLKVKREAEKEKEKELKLKKQKELKTKKEGFKLFRRNDVEPEPIPIDSSEKEKRKPEEPPEWDVDVEKLIPIIDNLLEKLPDEVIDEFAQSEDFNLYEKVILKYKNK